jgi:uracil-DNA glycosylase family 4
MNPWQQFCEKWKHGCGSEQCSTSNSIVLSRGQLPCDILFIGEAPGHSENTCGKPFVETAPAGFRMQRMIEKAVPNTFTYALTNLVGCIPLEDDSGTTKKAGQPSVDQVEKCAPRLQEFVELANPKLIVCVGHLARDWLDPKLAGHIPFHRRIPMVDILHPSYILRQKISTQEHLTDKAIVTIQQAIQEYLIDGKKVELVTPMPSHHRALIDDDDIPF